MAAPVMNTTNTGYRRVLITGISGVGSATALTGVRASIPSDEVAIYDVGELFVVAAQKQSTRLTAQTILNASASLLKTLRYGVLQKVLRDLERNPKVLSLLDIHATFMTTGGVIEGLSIDDARKLKSDLFVTVVDGPQNIKDRLKTSQADYFHLTIADIIKWQEIEVYVTHLLADVCERPHLVVSARDVKEILLRVIRSRTENSQGPVRVYASYPMTNLPDEQKGARDGFLEQLRRREDLIIFDPGAIESSHKREPYYSPEDLHAIASHTIVRDLNWFIGIDSQAVVAYMALNPGSGSARPAIVPSSGSNDELMYAYENGLDTYLVIGREKGQKLPPLSPFTTYKAKLFVTPDQFFEYLDLRKEERAAHDVISGELALYAARNEERSRSSNLEYHTANGSDGERFVNDAIRLCQYHLPEDVCKRLVDRGELRKIAGNLYELWHEPEGPPQLRLPFNGHEVTV